VDEAAVFGLIEDVSEAATTRPYGIAPVLEPDGADVEELYGLVHREPVNASFDSSFNVLPESDGVTFDLEAARTVFEGADYGQTVSVPLRYIKPDVYADELKALLFRDRLASVTTRLTNNEVRSKNIELAAARSTAIYCCRARPSHTTTPSGSAPSKRATERDGVFLWRARAAGGRRDLPAFLRALLLLPSGDLKIVFRVGHIYYQTYVPYGMDATVAGAARTTNSATIPSIRSKSAPGARETPSPSSCGAQKPTDVRKDEL
jgi:hypothetical protein